MGGKRREMAVWTDPILFGSFFVFMLMVVFAFYHIYVGQFADMFSVIGAITVAFSFMVVLTHYVLGKRRYGS